MEFIVLPFFLYINLVVVVGLVESAEKAGITDWKNY